MLYSEASIDQTHATTAQNYFFSANGIYDPNITGTGHQPMGFDTMIAYYEQATVVRSTITVQAYNNSSTVPARVWLSLAPDTTAITDTTEITENGLLRHVDLNTTGENKVGVISLGCDIAKYFGRQRGRGILNDVNLYNTAAANPTEQVYFNITSSGIMATSGTYNITFQAIISYDVVFWEPRKVVTSISRGLEKCSLSEVERHHGYEVAKMNRGPKLEAYVKEHVLAKNPKDAEFTEGDCKMISESVLTKIGKPELAVPSGGFKIW